MKATKALWTPASKRRPHLVLLGGGHTHVQVLRHLIMNPTDPTWSRAALDVTLIVDSPVAMYSGMVPGFVAGQYPQSALEIDVVPLTQLAGAKVILGRATAIHPHNRTISVEGRSPVHYDLVTIDIGSTVVGLELPGIKEHALASRPITRLVEQTESEMADAIALSKRSGRPANLVVVGGGAAGVELSFTMRQRVLDASGVSPEVTLVHAGDEILPGSPASLIRRVRAAATQRNIKIQTGTRVLAIKPRASSPLQTERPATENPNDPGPSTELPTKTLDLQDGSTLEADAVIWVAGAVPHSNFDPGSLPTNEDGFLSTRPTLQILDHDTIFAVGDCATLLRNPTPKAGVYAVRQGPVLIDNLERSLTDRPLRPYKPQSDFLALLNLGDGTAIGSKKQFSFEGRWVMRLKDRIDRKFMEKFQALNETASFTREFAAIAAKMSDAEDAEEMVCGGCAAKLEASALHSALSRVALSRVALSRIANSTQTQSARQDNSEAAELSEPEIVLGLEEPDDVAAWRSPSGDLIVRSVDAFSAFANDPWLMGRVAAQNALSDLFAKGVQPRFALALVGLPLDLSPADSEELLFQVLSGAKQSLAEAGVELLGGHTTIGQELWVGFSIDGIAEKTHREGSQQDQLLRSSTLNVGDAMVLTRPLGTGVLLHAMMIGQLSGNDYKTLIQALAQSNRSAGKLALEHQASAATDVTGFGLAGHLVEMLEGSSNLHGNDRLGLTLDLSSLPTLPGVEACFSAGLRSTAHRANATYKASLTIDKDLEHPLEPSSKPSSKHRGERKHIDLLFDPQTSGGLLIGIATDRVEALLSSLREHNYPQATMIGRVTALEDGPPITCGTSL